MEIDTGKIDDAVLGLLWLTLHDRRRAREAAGVGRTRRFSLYHSVALDGALLGFCGSNRRPCRPVPASDNLGLSDVNRYAPPYDQFRLPPERNRRLGAG